MKNGQTLPSKDFDFQYDHRLSFTREMGNIGGSKEVRREKFIEFMLLR